MSDNLSLRAASATVNSLGHTGEEGEGAEVTKEGAGCEGLEKSEDRFSFVCFPAFVLF
jgi:hypothetical protein